LSDIGVPVPKWPIEQWSISTPDLIVPTALLARADEVIE
jgi:hypothetical protein